METFVRQLVTHLIEDKLRLQAKLRHLVGELSEGALLEGKLDRTVRQRRKIIVDVVDQLVAKPPPLFCVKVKSHEGYLLRVARFCPNVPPSASAQDSRDPLMMLERTEKYQSFISHCGCAVMISSVTSRSGTKLFRVIS